MFDSVPTRAERFAAVIAIIAGFGAIVTAALGYGIAALALLFVALTCGTVAKARVSLDSLLTFRIREVSDDDPAAERYRERCQREAATVRDGIERADSKVAAHPRLEQAFGVTAILVGLAALAAVPTLATDDGRLTVWLLLFGLGGLTVGLLSFATPHLRENE